MAEKSESHAKLGPTKVMAGFVGGIVKSMNPGIQPKQNYREKNSIRRGNRIRRSHTYHGVHPLHASHFGNFTPLRPI